MKRRSFRAILDKHPGALVFFRPKEIYKLFRRQSGASLDNAIRDSSKSYFENRVVREKDIQMALSGAKQRGIINQEQAEKLGFVAHNFVDKPVRDLLGAVVEAHSQSTGKSPVLARISGRAVRQARQFLFLFLGFLYQRVLLHDFFEQRGIPVSDAQLNGLAQPKMVKLRELFWGQPIEKEIIAGNRRKRLEHGHVTEARKKIMQQIRSMLDRDFHLDPADKTKILRAAVAATKNPAFLERSFLDSQNVALRRHNAKLKPLLVQQGLGGLNVPRRISELRITEDQKAEFRRQLVFLLSRGPVTTEQIEGRLRAVEQPVFRPPAQKQAPSVYRPRKSVRSASSLFFESLQQRGILNGPQIRELRTRIARLVGPIRSLPSSFFTSLDEKIVRDPAVRGNPSKIVELVAAPQGSISPVEMRSTSRLLSAVPKTLPQLIAETRAPAVQAGTIIALRQRLAHLTVRDLADPEIETAARVGIRESILAKLASRGLNWQITVPALRLFIVKSPGLLPVFDVVLGQLVKEKILLEHHRGSLTVSLDPSQRALLGKYSRAGVSHG